MARRKGEKSRAQSIHAESRFLQRYNVELTSELKEDLIRLVQGKLNSIGRIRFISKQSCRTTDYVVERNKQFIRFIYDNHRKTIVTALPLGDYERFLIKEVI